MATPGENTVTFDTEIIADGNNLGIVVPESVVEAFDAGKRPPVKVTMNDYTYDSTVAVYGGKFYLPVAKVHREAIGLECAGTHEVTLPRVTGERTVDLPEDLEAALKEANLLENFNALSYSQRKEHARAVADAKKPETREKRIVKVVDSLGNAG